MSKYEEYESEVENVNSRHQENQMLQLEKEQSIVAIKNAIKKLENDIVIKNQLKNNLEKNESDLKELEKEEREIFREINDLINDIEYERGTNLDHLGEVICLEEIGEDVSDSEEILKEKDAFYNDCLEKLGQMNESLELYTDFLEEQKNDVDEKIHESSEKTKSKTNENNQPTFSDMFDDKDLFIKNKPGEYVYEENAYGKTASGQLILMPGERDSKAQKEAGGEARRKDDEGGHLIATIFSGSSDKENLVPMNINVNRGAYKRLENKIKRHLLANDKVYAHIEAYEGNGVDRPSAFMGYIIIESPDGKRDMEFISLLNESNDTLDEIEREYDEFLLSEDYGY